MPADRIRQVIEEKLKVMGYELYDLVHNRAGRHSALRVFVDSDAGITIADCEKVSHELSVVLDVEEFSTQSYNLEVSSPGLDRRLATEKDYKRAIGNFIHVQLSAVVAGKRELTGKLTSVTEGKIHLELEKKKKTAEPVEIDIKLITLAKIEIRF